jgi:DNA-binding NtrC family response regulator
MTPIKASPKVEDLVKKALKEALDKRKPPKAVEASTDVSCETIIEDRELMEASPTTGLKHNQIYLSEVIGQKVDHDFGITVFQESDWDERISGFVPSINSTYVIDAKLASDILQAWELNEKVLCYGPTGAGKSSLIEQLCARTYRPCVRVNCTGDMDSSMIFNSLGRWCSNRSSQVRCCVCMGRVGRNSSRNLNGSTVALRGRWQAFLERDAR